MQSIIKGILFTILLGFFTVAVAHEVTEREKFLGLIPDGSLPAIVSTVLSAMWMTWGRHVVPSKLIRNIITALLSAGIAGSGVYYVEKRAEKVEVTVSKKVEVTVNKTVDITVKETVNRYRKADSLALEDIRTRLAALPDTSVMDSLDACIDSHFINVRARLIRIEKKLE